MGLEYGLFGLVILALDIYAIIKVLGSVSSPGVKALWIVLIVFLPILGLIAWALAGPK